MKTSGNVVLITGGATGIGVALAEELINAGNEVIIYGRRESKLSEAKQKLPSIHTMACDLSKREGRETLYKHMESKFPDTNILVNNAGIQRIIDFKKGREELLKEDDEILINLVAPIELSAYFIPSFMKKDNSAIINISSGLGFIPIVLFPVYCATKAAMHSFSTTLRHQLRNTSVKVFEIIPPTTDTELDKGMRAKRGAPKGITVQEVAKASLKAIAQDEFESAIGEAQNLRTASRNNPEQTFHNMNDRIEI
jgi:uncharacterized oxidoreductase